MLDGHLFGAPIDILNRAAPLVLVSLGMTLVIATRGIDISVGAVVAIAGAAGGQRSSPTIRSRVGAGAHPRRASSVGVLAGMWNGLLVAFVGMQPIIATLILMVAGRGVAQLLTGGQIIPIDARRISGCRRRLSGARAVLGVGRDRGGRRDRAADEPHGARAVHPRDRHQSGRDASGRPALGGDRVWRLHVSQG